MKTGDLVMLKTSATLPINEVQVFRVTVAAANGWTFVETYFVRDGRRVPGEDMSFRTCQLMPFVPASQPAS